MAKCIRRGALVFHHQPRTTLRTPCGLDKNIVSVFSVLSLGVALRTDESGCERGSRNVHFLSINSISFRRSRGIVLVMACPARETDGAGRQWNAEKDVRNVRDFSVKRLPRGGTRSRMPQQTRYVGVCAGWEQNLCVFWSRPNPHLDRSRHCQWASSLVQHLWLVRFVSRQSAFFGLGLKSAPRWRYGAVRLAPTQWRCGSNSITAFGVYQEHALQTFTTSLNAIHRSGVKLSYLPPVR